MDSQKNYYKAQDIASMLDICYAKALEWIKYSGVPYIKIGRTYHVNIDTFNSFVSAEAND